MQGLWQRKNIFHLFVLFYFYIWSGKITFGLVKLDSLKIIWLVCCGLKLSIYQSSDNKNCIFVAKCGLLSIGKITLEFANVTLVSNVIS